MYDVTKVKKAVAWTGLSGFATWRDLLGNEAAGYLEGYYWGILWARFANISILRNMVNQQARGPA